MMFPLRANPSTKGFVFLVHEWHATMFVFLLKFDQLFILPAPFAVVQLTPNEPDFVQ
jgi:hypothetical protein